MPANQIFTLDLKFMGISEAIASYLIPHPHGVVLIESGPGTTIKALQAGLAQHGFSPADVTDVLLTHIHLDHAGASGWLARHGARIFVHPVGAPHMINPEKLLASATRIYGEMMDTLWGEFLPVPEDQLLVPEDGDIIEINALRFKALDTPGHANHHYAYLFEGVCFSGDIGAVRMPGRSYLRIPMPPPEFHLEKWRASLKRLSQEEILFIAPTHFGVFSDPDWHLENLAKTLNEVEVWIEATLPSEPSIEEINEKYSLWTRQRALNGGLTPEQLTAYEAAMPSWMSGYGMQRYWRKYRSQETSE